MRTVVRLLSGLAPAILLAGVAWAGVSAQGHVRAVFGPEERELIREYYRTEIVEQAWKDSGQVGGKKKALPPGLAKKRKLPPGIAKQIARGQRLPPGLERQVAPLPALLEERLKPLPPDHVRVVVGTDVLILDSQTQKVVDIIRDIAVLTRDIMR